MPAKFAKELKMSKKDVTMLLREFPQSIAAEAAVLGSIIIDPGCFAEEVNF